MRDGTSAALWWGCGRGEGHSHYTNPHLNFFPFVTQGPGFESTDLRYFFFVYFRVKYMTVTRTARSFTSPGSIPGQLNNVEIGWFSVKPSDWAQCVLPPDTVHFVGKLQRFAEVL